MAELAAFYPSMGLLRLQVLGGETVPPDAIAADLEGHVLQVVGLGLPRWLEQSCTFLMTADTALIPGFRKLGQVRLEFMWPNSFRCEAMEMLLDITHDVEDIQCYSAKSGTLEVCYTTTAAGTQECLQLSPGHEEASSKLSAVAMGIRSCEPWCFQSPGCIPTWLLQNSPGKLWGCWQVYRTECTTSASKSLWERLVAQNTNFRAKKSLSRPVSSI